MRTNYFFYSFFISLFFIADSTHAQNFEETWKEFLVNNKIVNMSGLVRPNQATDPKEYAQYLLMRTNNCFCQSKVEQAEGLMEEIEEIDYTVHESIPGFVPKVTDLVKKIEASHEIDKVWNRFLKTRKSSVEELEEIYPPSSICEKQTLVKYSYMTAHYYLCNEEFEKSKNAFERRTLKIAEKTSLRIRDVKGLAPEVAKMKKYYQISPKLDRAWEEYLETDVSPGFDIDMPLFPCYPIPNIKALVLQGAADPCGIGTEVVKKIRKLQADSGAVPDRQLKKKIKQLKADVKQSNGGLAALNKAWKAFLPDNKVVHTDYGYEYCENEPLIRAYIMDGYASVCDLAEDALTKIDSLRRASKTRLSEITLVKIEELEALQDRYNENSVDIERIWKQFTSNGDMLIEDYQSREYYCDHIHEVKDWVMKGLSGDCDEANEYMTKIEEFNETFEFKFYQDLECRVQKLRIKVWECRYEALSRLADLEASDSSSVRLQELMEEYGMGERPDVCESQH